MNKYYVYIYKDPRNNLPFYIGKGCENRAYKHLSETIDTTDNIRKYYKIQSIKKSGFEPTIILYQENLSEDAAYSLEEQLILGYGRKDFEENGILFNICLSRKPPDLTGKKRGKYKVIKKGDKRKPRTIEHSKNSSNALKGRISSFAGKFHTEKSKAKISKSKSNPSDKTRERMSKSHKGVSKTGLMDWDKVSIIRSMYQNGVKPKNIHTQFEYVSIGTIQDIIKNRTWVK